MPVAEVYEPLAASDDLDAFLALVEREVHDAARAMLFTGGRHRLEITLLRHERNPRVIWGLKGHEDWAFKATLLRFARSHEPSHFLLASDAAGALQMHGWEVHRTMDAFRATPLSSSQVEALWGQRLTAVPQRSEN
jgi:hypothetical protein